MGSFLELGAFQLGRGYLKTGEATAAHTRGARDSGPGFEVPAGPGILEYDRYPRIPARGAFGMPGTAVTAWHGGGMGRDSATAPPPPFGPLPSSLPVPSCAVEERAKIVVIGGRSA